MTTVHMKLESSDFTVERSANGRIHVQVDGEHATAVLDLDPEVANDLFLALANPEDPS